MIAMSQLSKSGLVSIDSASIVNCIHSLLCLDWEGRFYHCYRETNCCVDAIASIGCDQEVILCLNEVPVASRSYRNCYSQSYLCVILFGLFGSLQYKKKTIILLSNEFSPSFSFSLSYSLLHQTKEIYYLFHISLYPTFLFPISLTKQALLKLGQMDMSKQVTQTQVQKTRHDTETPRKESTQRCNRSISTNKPTL